jgi:hypothetical protein
VLPRRARDWSGAQRYSNHTLHRPERVRRRRAQARSGQGAHSCENDVQEVLAAARGGTAGDARRPGQGRHVGRDKPPLPHHRNIRSAMRSRSAVVLHQVSARASLGSATHGHRAPVREESFAHGSPYGQPNVNR